MFKDWTNMKKKFIFKLTNRNTIITFFYIPSVDINAALMHLSYTRTTSAVRSSRSFKQPPSPLYVYSFLHSFFNSFLIQCSGTWSKTPKNLGFGSRIDHFHNHFGIRIIDFFRQNASRPRKLTHTLLLHTTMTVLGRLSGYISSSSSVKIPKRLAGKDLLLPLDVLFGWIVVWYIADYTDFTEHNAVHIYSRTHV